MTWGKRHPQTALYNEHGKINPDWREAIAQAGRPYPIQEQKGAAGGRDKCPRCTYYSGKNRTVGCFECYARELNKTRRNVYLTSFEEDMLDKHAGLKTVPEFQEYMARHHKVFRTQDGWRRAAGKRNIRFTDNQAASSAAELAQWLGVEPKWVVKRIKAGEIVAVGKGATWLIPVEEVERVLAQAPTTCPFDDPLTIDEAAALMGYNRSYFVWLMNSPEAGLDPWLGPDRYKRVSRAKLLALKERMVREGLTARDLMGDRADRLRERGREGLRKLRTTRQQQPDTVTAV